jgi:hypothetical protein
VPWGWGIDNQMPEFSPRHVLYIELPQGQVSFHSHERFAGPDYLAKWDAQHASAERILRFCDEVLSGVSLEQMLQKRNRTRFKQQLRQQRNCSRPVRRHDSKPNWVKFCKQALKKRAGSLTDRQITRFAEEASLIALTSLQTASETKWQRTNGKTDAESSIQTR